MQSRVEQAVATFEEGYSCAQSVFATYADLFGIERQDALKLASALGGGVGRMREVCGAVSAIALLAGIKEGNTELTEDGKEKIYALTRQLADRFKEQNGSMICRELLNLTEAEESARPEARTPEYYAKRPCGKLIASASKIIEELLLEDMD